jgi:hypothetical protein
MAPSEKFWEDCEKGENDLGKPLVIPASPKNKKKNQARRDRRLAKQRRLAEEKRKEEENRIRREKREEQRLAAELTLRNRDLRFQKFRSGYCVEN